MQHASLFTLIYFDIFKIISGGAAEILSTDRRKKETKIKSHLVSVNPNEINFCNAL